jgi:hypothetical protein
MIDNPQAVKFSNEEIRTLADEIVRVSKHINHAAAEYVAQGLAGQFPNDATEVDDGSHVDGRSIITGADVNDMISIASDIKALLESEAGVRLTAIMKVQVNG